MANSIPADVKLRQWTEAILALRDAEGDFLRRLDDVLRTQEAIADVGLDPDQRIEFSPETMAALQVKRGKLPVRQPSAILREAP